MAGLSACVALYALGHAATALAAGLLGQILVARSSGTAVSDNPGLIIILYFGLLGTAVKVVGATTLAAVEARLVGDVGRQLRNQLATTVLTQGIRTRAPQTLASFATQIAEVEGAVARGWLARVRATAQLLPLAATVIALSPSLAIGGAAISWLFGQALGRLRAWLRAAYAETQHLAERGHTEVAELVQNADLWRTYAAGQRVLTAIDAIGQRTTSSAARAEAGRAALTGANELLGAIALLVAILSADFLGIAFDAGSSVAALAVLFMAYRPLRDLGDSRAWCIRGNASLEALNMHFDHLLEPLAIPALPGASAPDNPGRCWPVASLTLRGFGAKLRGPRVTREISAGTSLAITGPTGCGKTSFLRALLGLEPSIGTLEYAGQDLALTPPGPGSRPFAWVPQDAPLVTASLVDNVALAAPSLSEANHALAQVGALALLERCGDRPIGPNGQPLSGGERHLVAIARALATGLPVLVLDEPTEGLDDDASRQVLAALHRLEGARTLIVVTHRSEVAAAMNQRMSIPGAYEPHIESN